MIIRESYTNSSSFPLKPFIPKVLFVIEYIYPLFHTKKCTGVFWLLCKVFPRPLTSQMKLLSQFLLRINLFLHNHNLALVSLTFDSNFKQLHNCNHAKSNNQPPTSKTQYPFSNFKSIVEDLDVVTA